MLSIEQEKKLKKTLAVTGQCLSATHYSLEQLRQHINDEDDIDMELFDAEVLLRHAGDGLWELHKTIDRKLANAAKKRQPVSRRKLRLLAKQVPETETKAS